jgi:hypothetical protein
MDETITVKSFFVQGVNADLDVLRTQLRSVSIFHPQEALKIDPTLEVKSLPMPTRLGVCYNYAMIKTLKKHGINTKFNLVGCQDWKMQLRFFKPVAKLRKDDLVVYIEENKVQSKIVHFGLLFNPALMRVKSKWGTIKGIFKHNLFHLPIGWGTSVTVMRLKKEYRTSGIDQKMWVEYINTREDSLENKQILMNIKLKLIGLISASNTTKKNVGTIITILEQFPNISVNIRNNIKQTLLMIATHKNNSYLVELLLSYGARKNLKDMYEKTALDIAIHNRNEKIEQLLK